MRLGPRRGTAADLLVVGLGNPGKEFAGTRHNVGASVVELLAERHGERLRSGKERALVAEARVGGRRMALAFPQTFMNDSGASVQALVRRFGVADDLPRLVIVHDELDLPVGVVRIKRGGGLAGHKGLQSIKAHLHSDEFSRVRIGIDKPPGGKERGADHVLASPGKRERTELAVSVELAADAVELILAEGLSAAQTRVNATAPPAAPDNPQPPGSMAR
ncbi:MAG: aminoacyl-tRNA hydrolase [Acidimicrobiaceae bacterium]|nr:aminoacyl-tRNA hydrolase [Acidimicrobiaceae bacterium]